MEGLDVEAIRPPAVQAALHGFGHGERLGHRETDRGVDVHAAVCRLLERDDARLRGRELHLGIRGEGGKAQPLLEHPRSIRVVGRVRLDRQPAGPAALPLEDRSEDRRRPDRHLLDDRPRQIDLRPVRMLRRQGEDAWIPVGPFLTQDLEHDARVRGRPHGAALDRVRQLID